MAKYLYNELGELVESFEDNDILIKYDFLNIKRNAIKNKLFYKLYKDSTLLLLNKHLNSNVKNTLFGLIRQLEFNTNEFVSFNGIPANLKQISEFLNIPRKTLYNHIRILSEFEIIKKIKIGKGVSVMINPYFVSYGVDNTDEALTLFGNTNWAQASKNKKKKKYINNNL